MAKQCENTEVWTLVGGGKSKPIQCAYVAGHSGECLFSVHDESDAIRWKLAADRRDQLQREADVLAPKLAELRERWLDIPWSGEVDKGDGHWMQTLINAVSAIVDPDRTLREDPEAKRRGRLAQHRQLFARYREQVTLAERHGITDQVSHWTAKRDAVHAECLAEFGIDLSTEAR